MTRILRFPFICRFTCFLVLPFALTANICFGKMAARRTVPIEKVLVSLEQKNASGKAKPFEKELLILTKIAQTALGLQEITVAGSGSDDQLIKRLTEHNLLRSMSEAMRRHPRWDQTISPAALARVRGNKSLLRNTLGANSYEWAWFLKQLGEQNLARQNLARLYEGGYDTVMSMKAAVHGFTGGPLSMVESYLQALEPLSDASSNEQLRAKMQKMKIHVSNLPQSHIKT